MIYFWYTKGTKTKGKVKKMYSIPEESLESLCSLLCRASGGKNIKSEDGYYGWDSPCSAWYSRYNFNKVPVEQCSAAIEALKQSRTKGKPVFVYYTEEARTQDLGPALSENGFSCMSVQNGMAYDLVKVGESTAAAAAAAATASAATAADPAAAVVANQAAVEIAVDPAAVVGADSAIKKIDQTDVNVWSRVNAQAFGKPDEAQAFLQLMETKECDFYAYIADGSIVATAMLHRYGNNAGIHEVATLPEFRGRGIGKAMITRIIEDAQKLGIERISLQASGMGTALYERVGFKKLSHIKTWVCF